MPEDKFDAGKVLAELKKALPAFLDWFGKIFNQFRGIIGEHHLTTGEYNVLLRGCFAFIGAIIPIVMLSIYYTIQEESFIYSFLFEELPNAPAWWGGGATVTTISVAVGASHKKGTPYGHLWRGFVDTWGTIY